MWKVNRERITLLGGPAAAVLQVAHPKVARGVAEHSDFRNDSHGRLKRTLAAVYAIAFGTRHEVLRVAEQVHKMHARVKSDGNSGSSYSAFDADAQMWVLATLVSGAVGMYEQFVGSLTVQEKNAYFSDMRIWGELFGLDQAYGPQNWREFQSYYDGMITGDVLGSEDICASVAQRVTFPENPWLFRIATRPLEYLVTEMIPEPLLGRLRLRSKFWTQIAWSASKAVLPAVYAVAPDGLRYPVEYLRARELRQGEYHAHSASLTS